MAEKTSRPGSGIIPTLRYPDALAAIEWLCMAFGFQKHLVVTGEEEGEVVHAQLVLGSAMIMLGSSDAHQGNAYSDRVRPASELGGRTNPSIYVVVEDADASWARVVEAGAEILMAIEDQDYGGRGFSCLDPDGNVWSFGSYDPWDADS